MNEMRRSLLVSFQAYNGELCIDEGSYVAWVGWFSAVSSSYQNQLKARRRFET